MTRAELKIGEIAKSAEVSIQTIRYYERVGILKPTVRRDSGYRIYDQESLKKLHFIAQAKDLGFSLKEIQELFSLRIRSVQSCGKVKAKAEKKLQEIRIKITQLKSLEEKLEALVWDCKKKQISDCCPVINKMEMLSDSNLW